MFHLLEVIISIYCFFAVAESTELHCSVQQIETRKFVITSDRNATGHWIGKIQILHGELEDGREGEPLEVELQHHTTSCIADGSLQVDAQISTPAPRVAPPTGGGYIFFPPFGYYKRHTQKVTWNRAKEECAKEGAHLVVLNSVEEVLVVLQLSGRLLLNQPRDEWNREAWIGISDLNEEGQFKTIFGVPIEKTGYMKWGPGEPNNFKDEDCVSMMKSGLYNDQHCDQVLEFICELGV